MSLTSEQYENKIKELEKEVEELKKRQTVQMKRQHYGLTWVDVPEAFDKESENKIPVLEEVKEKAISNNDGKPTHILIEGDNYHALQCLNYTHKGKVDVIYIDPPYNTGSDGFKYKDARFWERYPEGTEIPKNHPLRHSYWISFMNRRLSFVKELLTKNGVLFISIDDNEYANLKLLCDCIFGEVCYVTTIVVEMSTTQGMKVKAAKEGTIVKNKEYILVYSKSGNSKIAKTVLYDSRPDYDSHYNKFITNNLEIYDLKDIFRKQEPDVEIRDLQIMYREEPRFKKFVEENISNIFADDKISGFEEYSLEVNKVYKIQKNERMYYIINNGTKIRQLLCLADSFGKTDDFISEYGLRKIRGDWWKDFYKDMGNVSKEGNIVYENGKKPVRLIKQIEKLSSTKNSIILDFFAGSGTTLHSTLLQNDEDTGNRQCILIQINENKICDEITYPRIQNVLNLLGNSLKYYKTSFVGNHDAINATDDDCVTLAKKAGCLLSLGENTLDEIQSTDFFQIYEDKNTKISTAIYFTEDLSHFSKFVETVKEVASNQKSVIVYTFSWSSCEDFIYEFEGISNVEIKAIPQPILEIYKSIYQK